MIIFLVGTAFSVCLCECARARACSLVRVCVRTCERGRGERIN